MTDTPQRAEFEEAGDDGPNLQEVSDFELTLEQWIGEIGETPVLANFQPRMLATDAPAFTNDTAEQIRINYFTIARSIVQMVPSGRHRSLALTDLESSMMWAIKALYGTETRDPAPDAEREYVDPHADQIDNEE